MTGGTEYPGRFRRLPGGLAPTPAIRVPTDEQSDLLQTVRKTEIESQEVTVEESVRADRADWDEEERGNVVTFFSLLDQWDHELNNDRKVA